MYNFNFNLAMLAHCKMCHQPLEFIYSSTVRDYCYECEMEAKIENAKEILGVK